MRDAELAMRYGFTTNDITAARHDLVTFLWTFHNNPFEAFDELREDIEKMRPKLHVSLIKLERLVENSGNAELTSVLIDMQGAVERLIGIQSRLPRRPHSLQSYAVRYLMAFWKHVERTEGYFGPREVVVSFNGEIPSHPSMHFILDMLGRTRDGTLKGVSRSTILRARGAKNSPIPLPNEINPFEGDAGFLE
ncbi:hypothetical protein ACLBXJ_02840 [Methylobacterium mesophilicum]